MKRKDMLNIIEEVVRNGNYYHETAIEVLEAIEKAGMLPPTLRLADSESLSSTKWLLDYSEIDYDLEWESEDT